MQQVNPSFNIQAPGIDFVNARLFAEAGPMGLSLVVMENDNDFRAVVVYSFAPGLLDHELSEKFTNIVASEKLLQRPYNKIDIFWSFPESILVPAELMNEDRNNNMLNLVFGDAKPGITRSDFLYRHNLHNVYRVPQFAVDIFSTCLPVAMHTHMFTTLVNQNLPAGNHIFSVFYRNSLTILLCKEGKLQVIQNFEYHNPDDCVFHLLNVCKGFDVNPNTVSLHIQGMIDQNSALYDTIYKYFLHIEFSGLPPDHKYDEAIKEQPSHFFSHLFALASCV